MKDSNGIRDWKVKQAFLRALFGVGNDKALVEAIVRTWIKEENKHELKDEVLKCYDSFRRWATSFPKGATSTKFWAVIINYHNLGDDVGMIRLCRASFIDFVDFFKDVSNLKSVVGEVLENPSVSIDVTLPLSLYQG